jgi:hypothetical protein
MQRYIYGKEIENIVYKRRHRERLYKKIEGHYIESKASDF